jgi:metal-responsive CopG/Arc/MetJ family transcriptional regulator
MPAAKKTYGINVSQSIANKIDEPLEYGDSRSERVRDLLEIGLEVEQTMNKDAAEIDRAAVRQAMIDYKQ